MECGIPEVSARSRQEAINPLVRSLAEFPTKQLFDKVQLLKKYDSTDRTLEAWTDIILKRKEESPK